MSTSCDETAQDAAPVVRTFLYHDTFVRPANADITAGSTGEAAQAKAASGEQPSRTPHEDISRLIAEARAEGLAEGGRLAAARFQEEVAQERNRIADLVTEFEQQRAEYYSKVEIELVHLALAIAAKILHRESQIDRMVVAGLVKVMLERFQQNTKVIVRVRPEEATGWTHYFSDHTNVEIVGDASLEPKACLLETDLGVADMALNAQLKEVEQGFFDLLAQRPDPK